MSIDLAGLFRSAGDIVDEIKGNANIAPIPSPPYTPPVQNGAIASVPYYTPGNNPQTATDYSRTVFAQQQQSSALLGGDKMKTVALLVAAGAVVFFIVKR